MQLFHSLNRDTPHDTADFKALNWDTSQGRQSFTFLNVIQWEEQLLNWDSQLFGEALHSECPNFAITLVSAPKNL